MHNLYDVDKIHRKLTSYPGIYSEFYLTYETSKYYLIIKFIH